MSEEIALKISYAIKNGKWLHITYKNYLNETTYYWIAVKDIDFETKKLKCTIYNHEKSDDCIDTVIKFDSIINATVLELTYYDVPEELYNKLEIITDKSKWLKYESFNNNILEYYIKCNELDNDPYQKEHCLIDGIDLDVLLKNEFYKLNDIQINQINKYIYKYDEKTSEYTKNDLIVSALSISSNEKKYVVVYFEILFDPSNKVLYTSKTPRINHSFLINDKKISLSSYLDYNPEEFINKITLDYKKNIRECTEELRENLRPNEIIDELPELMILERTLSANLVDTFNIIQEKNESGNLTYPLKAFFRDLTKRQNRKRKDPSIVIYDNKVNIDQMRVIFNSMKYPITYVQGPPGTGKTQTILNVVLSAFFNSKTTLICSSNNKPVDGIISKLKFKYKDLDVPFPYLRLGNRNEVNKSLNRILNLYKYQTDKKPIDNIINKIKNNNDINNKKLVNLLATYEKRKTLKEQIDSTDKLLNSISSDKIKIYKNIVNQRNILIDEFNKLDEVTDKEVKSSVLSASENSSFSSYIFFESLKYINKLKQPRYNELIEICKKEDTNEKITLFNKWCTDDNNIKLLEDAFPIIMTTNYSASKLGTANHLFDLVIMDEAGQCNCATALLPISRASSLLLVGDSNQLKPVIVLEETINEKLKKEYSISEDYDYSKHSILDLMTQHDNISNNIMLTYHYRCGKKIINYSNNRYYGKKLVLEHLKDEGELKLLDVKNMTSKKRNQNFEEAKEIVEYIKRNNLDDAAIITPFVNQSLLINQLLEVNNIKNVKCGTIHSVQGDEKNTIIISTSLSPKTSQKTFEWLKNNSEITNVAVTRAKERLVVVADTEALNAISKDKNNDLSVLVNYVKSNGETIVKPNDNVTIEIGNSNGSLNEDIFFKTISHFCSVNPTYRAERNVKLSKLFANDPILSKSKLEFDLVLYTKSIFGDTPRIAIELQGGEHFGNLDREKCDRRKSEICEKRKIKILFIPNSMVKSYSTIKIILENSSGSNNEQISFFDEEIY